MLNVCVPVLRRYDCLEALARSLTRSLMKVDCVHIVDNGKQHAKLTKTRAILTEAGITSDVFEPDTPFGVAESWNYFLKHVCEHRVICNDDIEFAPRSLEKIVACPQDFVQVDGSGFSCFMLRDSAVKKVEQYDMNGAPKTSHPGLFDEWISPGYAYYEDEDYMTRMLHAKVTRFCVECGVVHRGSQTLNSADGAQLQDHHRKFVKARSNYIRKWGGMPGPIKAALV